MPEKSQPRIDFGVFILTHGRADNVTTLKILRAAGYSGRIFLVVDDMDDHLPMYQANFGDDVLVFSKAEVKTQIDVADNFNQFASVIYARNVVCDLARQLGLKYFVQLDDDYSAFRWRYDEEGDYLTHTPRIKDVCGVFNAMVDFLEQTPSVTSIAMAQGGDFIGGRHNGFIKSVLRKRKAMNTFFCAVDRPFNFIGTMNDDVNTYTTEAQKGRIFLTIPSVDVAQHETQTNAGGLTDLYLAFGTYVKSFYTVMMQPANVTIKMMGNKHKRLHHSVSWQNTVPMIIRQEFKKA
jgi:hypothetical protein